MACYSESSSLYTLRRSNVLCTILKSQHGPLRSLALETDFDLIIVGGGFPSLVLAQLASKFFGPLSRIAIIEAGDAVGGMFSSWTNSDGEIFDHGIHILYETGQTEIDNCIHTIIESGSWNKLKENRKDISGILYQGKLQKDTPYPDLRTRSNSDRERYIASITRRLCALGDIENPADTILVSARAKAIDKFGQVLADEVIGPILKNIYGYSANELDGSAFEYFALDRVALFDENLALDLMRSEFFRSRIAFPNQLGLPQIRKNSRAGFYPEKLGMQAAVNNAVNILLERQVSIKRNSKVTKCRFSGDRNSTVSIVATSNNGQQKTYTSSIGVLWNAGVFSLAKAMDVSVATSLFDVSPQKYLVHLVLTKEPLFDPLYYFYNFDNTSDIFRVTNYSGYCPSSTADGKFRISIEYWPKSKTLLEEVGKHVLSDLRTLNLIDIKTIASINVCSISGINIPTPTTKNLELTRTMIQNLRNTCGSRIYFPGLENGKIPFFSADSLIAAANWFYEVSEIGLSK